MNGIGQELTARNIKDEYQSKHFQGTFSLPSENSVTGGWESTGFPTLVREKKEKRPDTKVKAENLYQTELLEETSISTVRVIQLRAILKKIIDNIEEALQNSTDDFIKEISMQQATNQVLKLTPFMNLDELVEKFIFMLHNIFSSKFTKGYSRDEIYALKKVLIKFKENPIITEAMYDECLDILEEAGLEWAYPISEVSDE